MDIGQLECMYVDEVLTTHNNGDSQATLTTLLT